MAIRVGLDVAVRHRRQPLLPRSDPSPTRAVVAEHLLGRCTGHVVAGNHYAQRVLPGVVVRNQLVAGDQLVAYLFNDGLRRFTTGTRWLGRVGTVCSTRPLHGPLHGSVSQWRRLGSQPCGPGVARTRCYGGMGARRVAARQMADWLPLGRGWLCASRHLGVVGAGGWQCRRRRRGCVYLRLVGCLYSPMDHHAAYAPHVYGAPLGWVCPTFVWYPKRQSNRPRPLDAGSRGQSGGAVARKHWASRKIWR